MIPPVDEDKETSRQMGKTSVAPAGLPAEPGEDVGLPLLCPAGIELFRQGSQAEAAFVIETGLVKLIRVENDGREMIVDLRYPGGLPGAAEIIARQAHSLTAITVTKCHLLRFPGESFLSRLKHDPHLSWFIHQSHSQELHHQQVRMMELGCLSARQRLEHLLLQLSTVLTTEPAARPVRFRLPLKYWEIAELLAITPGYLSRLLSEMEKDKLIRKTGRNLILLDPLSLWRWTDEKLPSV